jgi:prophage regulatory protein
MNHLVFLRLPAVKARVGLSRSEIYRRVAAGTFPPPTKIGLRASAWTEAAIDLWCEERIADNKTKGH